MRARITSSMFFAAVAAVPVAAGAYPNGTPLYVTDAAPFCAACHAVRDVAYVPDLPPELSSRETVDVKHYAAVRAGSAGSPYAELTQEQRERIVEEAKSVDAHSTVTLSVPASVKPGEEVKIVVKARGGNGPAIGVMLVDEPLRYQARPLPSDGWVIVGAPLVRDQRQTEQVAWADSRMEGLKDNLSFVLVTEQEYNPAGDLYPAAEVTWTVRAPTAPGTYSVTAAMLYGTENARTASVTGRASGRILFSQSFDCVVKAP